MIKKLRPGTWYPSSPSRTAASSCRDDHETAAGHVVSLVFAPDRYFFLSLVLLRNGYVAVSTSKERKTIGQRKRSTTYMATAATAATVTAADGPPSRKRRRVAAETLLAEAGDVAENVTVQAAGRRDKAVAGRRGYVDDHDHDDDYDRETTQPISAAAGRTVGSGLATNERAALMDLGTVATFDPNALSPATLDSMSSHIRLLRRNGVPLTREALVANPYDMVSKLRDSKGKPLSSAYQRQILITVKHMFPEDSGAIKLPKRRRRRRDSDDEPFATERTTIVRAENDKFMTDVRRMIERAAELIASVFHAPGVADLGMYDTCVAILLSCATSLRIHEISMLRMNHIRMIRDNMPIAIKSKARNNLRNIAMNSVLEMLFPAIESQRPKVARAVLDKPGDKPWNRPPVVRLEGGYIVISSIDHMRKKLKTLAAAMAIPRETLGFNLFRSYIVTVLSDGGGHLVAKSLNNHGSLDTTMDNYHVATSSAAERTYDTLDQLMKEEERIALESMHGSAAKRLKRSPSTLPKNEPPPTPAPDS